MSKIDFWLISGLVTVLLGMVTLLAKSMHNQAMSKLDKVVEAVNGLTTTIAIHDEKLSTGSAEFEKIEVAQKEQDLKIQELDTRLTKIEVNQGE